MDASDWIALLGLCSGIIIFLIGLFQYRETQQWKRAEFVANEIKEFNSQSTVKSVFAMLDWSERQLLLFPERDEPEDQYILFTDSVLKSALTIHPLYEAINYTSDEIRIRDNFDDFFDYIGRFENFIQAGLVTSKDFQPYLIYWLKRIGEKEHGWKKAEVIETIWIYIDFYGFHDVQAFFKRYGYDIHLEKNYLTKNHAPSTDVPSA